MFLVRETVTMYKSPKEQNNNYHAEICPDKSKKSILAPVYHIISHKQKATRSFNIASNYSG